MSVFYRLSARKSLLALTLPVVNEVICPFISFQFHIFSLNIVNLTHGPILVKLVMFMYLEYPCYYERGSSL